ncbi:NAD-dependent epimerase/dehydratase family protein [Aeromicrobium wangtongii]|uniref:Sugar nucleotide-binding protein n=1 Tax=Aeromicrobium wangtongii TaxID=2969247 RepID=A0ABY5M3T2_9ACTN|nr:NAD-dependent epimerase/dehydratase family protein [Aeromicrobium wangtongii]MCD9199121.1 sugar nucleotide-binding protein [Aeromicrobium wangtongii]UUP12848.1 sugar nucleotide-binding protein [Aeromicrobium wangtongii]
MAAVLMAADALLIGCGDLGADIGLRLAAQGHDVVAIRRRGDLVPSPLTGVSADLTRERPVLPALDLDRLVVALTARPRSEQAYRQTYVEGMQRALDAVDAAGQRPARAVLVSSTAVYADADPGRLLDETTPPEPGDGPGRMLLKAERVFLDRVPAGTVVRFSGLYGHGEPRLVAQVQRGEVSDPHRWTNRIHRDDAAAAVVHLLTMDDQPERLYIGTDDEPALLGDVAAHVAAQLELPAPPRADPARGHGKRLSNARLRASGWVPQFPTYRQGYVADQ